MHEGLPWHETTIQQLTTLLQPRSDVHALLVVGSVASGMSDQWSDLDVMVVVADHALATFFPSMTWLNHLGPVFAYEQFPAHNRGTTRACFTDGRRIDLVIATESCFASDTDWPLRNGVRVLFTRSSRVLNRISKMEPHLPFIPPSDEEFTTLSRHFWFHAVMALTKIVRNDLLIGLHLCLESIQDTCVLAMMLRDRAEGTTIHKTGGVGNQFVLELPVLPQPLTAHTLLDSLDHISRTFDTFAAHWSPRYQRQHETFHTWIMRVRVRSASSD